MKKTFSILLVLCMILALAACGKTETPAAPAAEPAAPAGEPAAPAAEPAAPAAPALPELGDDVVNSEIDVDNPSTEGSVLTLSVNHVGATTHPYQYGCAKFAQLVHAYTGGEIGVTVYPASQIASGAKAIEFVQLGTLDMCLESTMAMENFVKKIGVLNLPFLFATKEQAYAVLDGPVGDELEAIAEESGFKILCWMDNGFRDITNTKLPITKPDDLKGMKLRTPESSVFIDTFSAFGATPTPMAVAEVFSAMQLGTVDGQENPVTNNYNNKFYEICPYYTVSHHIYTGEPLMLSLDKWNSLTPLQQEALMKAAEIACQYEREKSDAVSDELLQKIKDYGVAVNELTAEQVALFQSACGPIYDKYTANFGDLIGKVQAAVAAIG